MMQMVSVQVNAAPIVKSPGETFGASISFDHKGPSREVWAGVGLAYGMLVGHNPPFTYAMNLVTVGDDLDWKSYTVEVEGLMPADVQTGSLLDAQRFVSDAMPVAGQQPPNPFGINDWDDEVYATPEAPSMIEVLLGPMAALMMIGMIGQMASGMNAGAE